MLHTGCHRMFAQAKFKLCRVRWLRRVVFCGLCVLLMLLLLAAFALWIIGRVREFTDLLNSVQFDPEPTLSISEAAAVAATYPMPTGSIAVVKRLHFMYRGHFLDDKLRPLLTSWRQVYPEYKMYFWTDREINELVRRRYPAWQNMYHRQLSNYLERSDTARAFVLHALGGWYADVDTGSLRRADGVAAEHALILPLEPYVHAVGSFNKRRLVSNAIMYSAAGHPFWMYFLRNLNESLVGMAPRNTTMTAVFVTGPVALTKTALLFVQAHDGTGCPGPRCPHLAQPVHFMPMYDDNTLNMRKLLRLHCTYITFITHAGYSKDCKHYRRHDFRNYLDSTLSFTYHSFMHLNERIGSVRRKSDVRNWGLGLLTGDEILDGV